MALKTPIFHPEYYVQHSGEGVPRSKAPREFWDPSKTLRDLIGHIRRTLAAPEFMSGVNERAAKLVTYAAGKEDTTAFDAVARAEVICCAEYFGPGEAPTA